MIDDCIREACVHGIMISQLLKTSGSIYLLQNDTIFEHLVNQFESMKAVKQISPALILSFLVQIWHIKSKYLHEVFMADCHIVLVSQDEHHLDNICLCVLRLMCDSLIKKSVPKAEKRRLKTIIQAMYDSKLLGSLDVALNSRKKCNTSVAMYLGWGMYIVEDLSSIE